MGKETKLTETEIKKLTAAGNTTKTLEHQLSLAKKHQGDIVDLVIDSHNLDPEGNYTFDGEKLIQNEKIPNTNGVPKEAAKPA